MRSGMTARPVTPGLSSLSANSSWWPTQMQIVGRPARMRSRRTVSSPCSLSRAIEAPNAPTPGSMTCEAAVISCGLSATRGSAPRRRKAACTEARLAVPVGAIRTSGMVLGRRGELDAVVNLVEGKGNAEVAQLDGAVLVHSFLERGRTRPRVQGDERQLLGDDEVVPQARDQAVALPLTAGVVSLAGRREHLDYHDRLLDHRGALVVLAAVDEDIRNRGQVAGLHFRPVNERTAGRAPKLLSQRPVDVALDHAVRVRRRRHHYRHT